MAEESREESADWERYGQSTLEVVSLDADGDATSPRMLEWNRPGNEELV
jgi:hypothetical protein